MQDVLKFLQGRKENRSWYKASRVAVTVSQNDFNRTCFVPKRNCLTTRKIIHNMSYLYVTNFQVLGDTFASQMQKLLGNGLQDKDLEAPRCIRDVQSMLGKDAMNHRENYYF